MLYLSPTGSVIYLSIDLNLWALYRWGEDVLVITMVLEISSPCPWTCWISTANPENLTPNFPTTTKLGSTTHKSDIRFFYFITFLLKPVYVSAFFANMSSCRYFCVHVWLSLCLAVCMCTFLPVHMYVCMSTYLPAYMSAFCCVCLSLYAYLNTYLGLHVLPEYIFPCLLIVSVHFWLSTCLPV